MADLSCNLRRRAGRDDSILPSPSSVGPHQCFARRRPLTGQEELLCHGQVVSQAVEMAADAMPVLTLTGDLFNRVQTSSHSCCQHEAVHARLFARKLRVGLLTVGLSTFVNGLRMSVVIYFHVYPVVVSLRDGDLGLLDYDFEFSGTYVLFEVHGGGHLGPCERPWSLDRGGEPMAGTATCCTRYIRCCPFFPCTATVNGAASHNRGWRRRHLSPGHKAGPLAVLLTCAWCAFQVRHFKGRPSMNWREPTPKLDRRQYVLTSTSGLARRRLVRRARIARVSSSSLFP